ncbi:MAG: polyamine aminopropyltransferase [Chloroflexi bacterium]|nr:polyamine aminopropyltransferase [Chloroflexota bacterium]
MSDATWLAELPRHGWQQRFQTLGHLFEARSEYQRIEVWQTVPFGRTLVLDGAVQTTEQDEFIYHEMLVHVPLCTHPRPERVLIIGGGDGGCLRRVLQHPVREAVQVEIDAAVVEVSRRWLPSISAGAYDDPRARLVIGDGLAYLEAGGEAFDVILVDSTDPVGPATLLFGERFYRAAAARLRRNGLLAAQSGSPLLQLNELRQAVAALEAIFARVGVYLANIPSYPAVLWSFALASATVDPARLSPARAARRLAEQGITPRYYTPALQRAAFALPSFLKRLLEERAASVSDAPIRALSGQPASD